MARKAIPKISRTGRSKPINWFAVIWLVPEYFDKWRVFPRMFLSVYMYLLCSVVFWFMMLPDPNTQQAGLVSVLVGVGAAWFGIYVNGTPTQHISSMPKLENTEEFPSGDLPEDPI